MAITKVSVEEDCTLCGLCESICPDVFRLGDEISEVIEGADFTANEDCIKEAAESCPVEVIKFE